MVVEPLGHCSAGSHSVVRSTVRPTERYGGAASAREVISAIAGAVFVESVDVECQEHTVLGTPDRDTFIRSTNLYVSAVSGQQQSGSAAVSTTRGIAAAVSRTAAAACPRGSHMGPCRVDPSRQEIGAYPISISIATA